MDATARRDNRPSRRVHQDSSENSTADVIDLTVPEPPRIIHPRALPSQSVEIVEIDSDDGSDNDDVQFIRESIAPQAGSSRGNGANRTNEDSSNGGGGVSLYDSPHHHGTQSYSWLRQLIMNGGSRRSVERSMAGNTRASPSATNHQGSSGSDLWQARARNTGTTPNRRRHNLSNPFLNDYDPFLIPRVSSTPYTPISASGSHTATPTTGHAHRPTSRAQAQRERAQQSAQRSPTRVHTHHHHHHHFPNSGSPNISTYWRRAMTLSAIQPSLLGTENPPSQVTPNEGSRNFGRRMWESLRLDGVEYRVPSPPFFEPQLFDDIDMIFNSTEGYGRSPTPLPRFPPASSYFDLFLQSDRNEENRGQTEGAPDFSLEDIEIKPIVSRPGHTKAIAEDIYPICPICLKELGHQGKEATKLWVVIGCGHVICGDCVEEPFTTRTPINSTPRSARTRRGSTTATPSTPRTAKGKGKAMLSTAWTAVVDGEIQGQRQGQRSWQPNSIRDKDEIEAVSEIEIGQDGVMSENQETSPSEPPAPPAYKIVKKASGTCPSCHRKIRKTTMQQLYL